MRRDASGAREVYDWARIIPQYEALWSQLTEIRTAHAKELKPRPHPWPARMDPFQAYASYPTQTLTPQTVLGRVNADAATAMQRAHSYMQLDMVNFASVVLPNEAEVQSVLQAMDGGPQPASELIQTIPVQRRAFVFRALTWLVKLGILKVCSSPA